VRHQANAFRELIAPLTPADLSALWRSGAIEHQRASGDDRFAALLDWNGLWGLVAGAVIPPEHCRVTYARKTVAPLFYADAGRLNPDRFAGLLDQGVSMVLVKLDAHVTTIAAICRHAAAFGARIVHAGAIVTTGREGAFEAHYDVFHLIVLQVEGSKRWRIYGPRVGKPVAALAAKDPPQTPPILDTVLLPGDSLFLPAGYWHTCDNGPGRSLHIVLGCDQADAGAETFEVRGGATPG
jgi:hypothetical protein